MTFDHVGLLLQVMHPYDLQINELANVFRAIGRLALPLFVFMIVEGVIHTKSFKKYILRLGILAVLISIFFMVVEYVPTFRESAGTLLRAGNIFLDLSLIAISVYLLKSKEIWKKLLTLLPVAFSFLSFIVKGLENSGMDIYWFPCFLTMQYDYFSLLLGIGFYYAYQLGDLYIKMLYPTSGLDKTAWESNGNYRLLVNIISVFLLGVVSFLFYINKYVWPEGVFWSADTQLFALISGAFILLYNGQRGYNAKWFQYGSYLYYPLHIIVIILIFIITNGGL